MNRCPFGRTDMTSQFVPELNPVQELLQVRQDALADAQVHADNGDWQGYAAAMGMAEVLDGIHIVEFNLDADGFYYDYD